MKKRSMHHTEQRNESLKIENIVIFQVLSPILLLKMKLKTWVSKNQKTLVEWRPDCTSIAM